MNGPELYGLPYPTMMNFTMNERSSLQSVTVRIKEDTHRNALKAKPTNPSGTHPDHRSGRSISPVLAHADPRAPPTYPFLAYATVKDRSEVANGPA